ncbi:elongation factor P hydroxylase [Parendozoicomonas haliclonae]|uniref:Elongation factor P hydroxylase n=1 Tax=Parendozoicomonas haliclonae TaxID=1960125 RepID=A0A1X7AI79_9GAMM|nr:elongation factor P hydroxylase [Parendozoicomonas haliclonae]SMA43486.1 Elongation factor P hydroxylase [Parendozoicomonas haliclonae]
MAHTIYNINNKITQHNDQDLIRIFNNCFHNSYNTILQGGAPEPLYTPADEAQPARIDYRDDYFASALHEIAHWCIAGKQRRLQEDFGYWYEPDGRSHEQQALFEKVEVKPQAMEWIFSLCCRAPFRISADNLMTGNSCSDTFRLAVEQQARNYLMNGLPERAGVFARALADFYRSGEYPTLAELPQKRSVPA